MVFEYDELLRMVLAVAAGALIGIEREFRDKAAGFRTQFFSGLGAAGAPERITAGTWTTTAIGCRAYGRRGARHTKLVRELSAASGVGSVRYSS